MSGHPVASRRCVRPRASQHPVFHATVDVPSPGDARAPGRSGHEGAWDGGCQRVGLALTSCAHSLRVTLLPTAWGSQHLRLEVNEGLRPRPQGPVGFWAWTLASRAQSAAVRCTTRATAATPARLLTALSRRARGVYHFPAQ